MKLGILRFAEVNLTMPAAAQLASKVEVENNETLTRMDGTSYSSHQNIKGDYDYDKKNIDSQNKANLTLISALKNLCRQSPKDCVRYIHKGEQMYEASDNVYVKAQIEKLLNDMANIWQNNVQAQNEYFLQEATEKEERNQNNEQVMSDLGYVNGGYGVNNMMVAYQAAGVSNPNRPLPPAYQQLDGLSNVSGWGSAALYTATPFCGPYAVGCAAGAKTLGWISTGASIGAQALNPDVGKGLGDIVQSRIEDNVSNKAPVLTLPIHATIEVAKEVGVIQDAK